MGDLSVRYMSSLFYGDRYLGKIESTDIVDKRLTHVDKTNFNFVARFKTRSVWVRQSHCSEKVQVDISRDAELRIFEMMVLKVG